MTETLKERTARGLFWGAMNSGTTQVLNLVIGVVLARLLSPDEYGIVGVLAIFTAIAGDLQSAGFTQALVNIHRPTARDYNSVFSFNTMMSVVMYAVLFLCAPLIADYFHQECLVSVSRVTFLSFFISSLGIAHGGYMIKNMMNREIAITGAVALIVSGGVGILTAALGFSYWALVWQQIAYITATNLGRYYYVREWRPRLTLDFGPVRQMAPFALKILVTKIVNTLSNNILTVVFGRIFSMHAVGNYSQAYKWNSMAHSLVSNTVGQVAQTVMVESEVETETLHAEERSLRIYRKMTRFACFLAMPMMFGLALVAEEFILVTIGEKWIDSVPLLRILCISGAFMPLYTMYQNLAISQGRSDIYMWLNILQIVLQTGIILFFVRYGMPVMVTAYSVFMMLWLLPWQYFAGHLIQYRWIDAIKDVAPFALIASVCMTATYFATSLFENKYLLMSSRIVMAALLYFVLMRLADAEIMKECQQYVKKKIMKKC